VDEAVDDHGGYVVAEDPPRRFERLAGRDDESGVLGAGETSWRNRFAASGSDGMEPTSSTTRSE
jgi:hypothetical protein